MDIRLLDTPCLESGWLCGEIPLECAPHGPTVLFDFSQLRAQRLASAQQLAVANTAISLATHPLATFSLPVIAWPQLTIALSVPEVHWPRAKIASTLNYASHFSLAFAVALALLFAGPIAVLETQSLISQAQYRFSANKPITQLPNPEPQPAPTAPLINSPRDVFSINISALGIESTITANVDTAQPNDYENALKEGIAHAAGTGLPGQLDVSQSIYLFAHSTDNTWNITRYNAQFYGLKDAEIGQEIDVRFWGEDYRYAITAKEIVPAADTTWLQPQFEGEKLILQTCYPPGTAWRRLIIIAEPIVSE